MSTFVMSGSELPYMRVRKAWNLFKIFFNFYLISIVEQRKRTRDATSAQAALAQHKVDATSSKSGKV